jgi:hypothetical protein
MKKTSTVTAPRYHGVLTALLFAAVLALLFWRSFLPGFVHFSNDGPLGQQNAAWARWPQSFLGSWGDLNDIGANTGSHPPTVNLLIGCLGPVWYASCLAPIALFILGLGAWSFFRQLKLSPLAATLGALAAMLNSAYFATACWGVATQQIAIGWDFFALALVVSNTSGTPVLIRLARLAGAGLAVGMNVMEGADIGAIFSLIIAGFVFFRAVAGENGSTLVKTGRGIGQVVMIALFAGFIAFQTVLSLVSTQIVGVVGMGQDTETKAKHWDIATQWSLPKTETLGLFVPGVFGYKYDTPKDMMDFLQNSYQGGVYWGLVGCDPSWDSYFANGEAGTPGQGIFRFAGGQNYAGILVVLVALWAIAQSLRRKDSVFTTTERKYIWFWAAILTISLLLAWGRFAPFYKLLYMLPYFSTIRNPAKFLLVFSLVIVVLFAYGVDALKRCYLKTSAAGSTSLSAQLRNWWTKAGRFERNWTWSCLLAFGISVLAWLVYAAEKPGLIRYLQKAGFPDEETAKQMAVFSVGQVSWFIVLLGLAIGLCLLVLAGVFTGKRARLGGVLLGVFLVADLGRADLPYITHWHYIQKYDIDPNDSAKSTNPLINFLRDRPYEHRVAYGLPWPLSTPPQFGSFDQLYKIEWMQHHFPYYNIQSLDVVQRPRLPADLAAYEGAFQIGIKQNSSGQLMVDPGTFPEVTRRWELTNTRYLLGPAGLLELLNEQFDPLQHRFRIIQKFSVLPKPGIAVPDGISPEQFVNYLPPDKQTAFPNADGPYALFDFTGALPRAKLYSHWQINTNDAATLQTLASTNFDAWQTVLVSTPLPVAPAANVANENPGTVEYKSYVPKDIKLDVKATAPSVLLLNDRFDPDWHVFVDGKPAELLRCNFIMRGVYLTPEAHTVEFQFNSANKSLYVTLTAIVFGILLVLFGGFRIFSTRRNAKPAI